MNSLISALLKTLSVAPGANEPWLVYLFVFVAAVLGVEAVYWLVYRTQTTQKAINRRLALGAQLPNAPAVLEALRRERGLGEFPDGGLRSFNEWVIQTGLKIDRTALVASVVGAAALFFLVFGFFLGFGVIALLISAVLAPTSAFLVLRTLRSRRIAKFSEQLPDAIDIITRGARVGHTFSTAVGLVARELPDPIGTEFGITADEITFGQDVTTAISNLHRRVGQDDLLFMVIVISVQAQTGGNLAEILTRLSTLIRQRAKLRLKIKALSAEGRMSAWLLTAMPFVLFVVVRLMSPHYFDDLAAGPFLAPALAYGFLSLAIGNFWIFRMVNFKF